MDHVAVRPRRGEGRVHFKIIIILGGGGGGGGSWVSLGGGGGEASPAPPSLDETLVPIERVNNLGMSSGRSPSAQNKQYQVGHFLNRAFLPIVIEMTITSL